MNGKLTLISLSRTHKYLLLLVLKYFIHPLFPQRKALSFSVSIANLSPPRHLHRKKVIKYPLTILLKILNVFIPRQTCVTIKTSKCEKYFHLYPLLIVIIPLYYVGFANPIIWENKVHYHYPLLQFPMRSRYLQSTRGRQESETSKVHRHSSFAGYPPPSHWRLDTRNWEPRSRSSLAPHSSPWPGLQRVFVKSVIFIKSSSSSGIILSLSIKYELIKFNEEVIP